MCHKKSNHGGKWQCHESLSPVSFFKSKIHEWHSSVTQRNSDFHCGILRLEPAGRSGGLRHKQDPTDRDMVHSVRQINSSSQLSLVGPATWSSILPESLSSLTLDLYTSSAGSPSSGPEGVRTMGLCRDVCVFACVCVHWTQKRVTSYDMKGDWRTLSQLESTGGSTMLTVLQLPINCHLSQVCLLNHLRHKKKKKDPVLGFS